MHVLEEISSGNLKMHKKKFWRRRSAIGSVTNSAVLVRMGLVAVLKNFVRQIFRTDLRLSPTEVPPLINYQ